MPKFKSLPIFTTEAEERAFWATHDSSAYFDWTQAVVNPALPNLKFSTKSITIQLPEIMLTELKQLANKRDVPYQSLVKVLLAEKLSEIRTNYKIPATSSTTIK